MIFVYDFVVDLYNVPPTSFSRLPHHSFPPPQPPNALARPSLLLGIETIAHLRQPANAKLTIMFVALSGGPRIVRLFGKGRVLERSTREFEEVRLRALRGGADDKADDECTWEDRSCRRGTRGSGLVVERSSSWTFNTSGL